MIILKSGSDDDNQKRKPSDSEIMQLKQGKDLSADITSLDLRGTLLEGENYREVYNTFSTLIDSPILREIIIDGEYFSIFGSQTGFKFVYPPNMGAGIILQGKEASALKKPTHPSRIIGRIENQNMRYSLSEEQSTENTSLYSYYVNPVLEGRLSLDNPNLKVLTGFLLEQITKFGCTYPMYVHALSADHPLPEVEIFNDILIKLLDNVKDQQKLSAQIKDLCQQIIKHSNTIRVSILLRELPAQTLNNLAKQLIEHEPDE